jgi:hypothetical protein
MSTIEPSITPSRGKPTTAEQSAAGKNGGARKLDANAIEALWAEVVALNRAAGPWGVVRAGREGA